MFKHVSKIITSEGPHRYLRTFGGLEILLGAASSLMGQIVPTQVTWFLLVTGALIILIELPGIISDLKIRFRGLPFVRKIYWDYGITFLGFTRNANEEIKIGQFQVYGENRTGKHISSFSGHVKSLLSGKEFPAYISHQGVPIPFDQTNGIPNKAKFHVSVPFVGLENVSNPLRHINSDDFISTIGAIEFVVNYDNKIYRKKFSLQNVEKLIDSWRRETRGTPRPHVSLKGGRNGNR